ncbi:hypothetical protein ACKFKG_19475 [Phormidesmis sp. 146-35]
MLDFYFSKVKRPVPIYKQVYPSKAIDSDRSTMNCDNLQTSTDTDSNLERINDSKTQEAVLLETSGADIATEPILRTAHLDGASQDFTGYRVVDKNGCDYQI